MCFGRVIRLPSELCGTALDFFLCVSVPLWLIFTTETQRHREQKKETGMQTIIQDLRYGLRVLLKHPQITPKKLCVICGWFLRR
jgi:hypothetical protein